MNSAVITNPDDRLRRQFDGAQAYRQGTGF